MLVFLLALVASLFCQVTARSYTSPTRRPDPLVIGFYRRPEDHPFEAYRKLYLELDKNKDNRVSVDEFTRESHAKALPKGLEYFAYGDEDNDQQLDFYEFRNALINLVNTGARNGFFNDFNLRDFNGDNEIVFEEYLKFEKERPSVARQYSDREHHNEFVHLDQNRNGVVSRAELRQAIGAFYKSKLRR